MPPGVEVQSSVALANYKIVVYRKQPSGWVAEVPPIEGCHAVMPTRTEALCELERVFALIEAEYREIGVSLPDDTTEIMET